MYDPIFWNMLPRDLTNVPTLDQFKSKSITIACLWNWVRILKESYMMFDYVIDWLMSLKHLAGTALLLDIQDMVYLGANNVSMLTE